MLKINREGQQFIEYLLLFVIVTLVILAGFGPGGPMKHKIETSLDTAFDMVEDQANNVFYNVEDEPWNYE